jgi:hypothetical protein
MTHLYLPQDEESCALRETYVMVIGCDTVYYQSARSKQIYIYSSIHSACGSIWV